MANEGRILVVDDDLLNRTVLGYELGLGPTSFRDTPSM